VSGDVRVYAERGGPVLYVCERCGDRIATLEGKAALLRAGEAWMDGRLHECVGGL
jgi:hypothetical protein